MSRNESSHSLRRSFSGTVVFVDPAKITTIRIDRVHNSPALSECTKDGETTLDVGDLTGHFMGLTLQAQNGISISFKVDNVSLRENPEIGDEVVLNLRGDGSYTCVYQAPNGRPVSPEPGLKLIHST